MELKTARGRLFLFILLLVAFPLLNNHLNIIRSSPLNNVRYAANPALSFQSWWDGSFQNDENLHVNDFVGFRPDMIRLNNQLDFYLSHKINSGGIVMKGRHNLFYTDYIDAWCGTDYAGDNYPVPSLAKMKKVQDTLEHMGKLFVFVHAASKVSYNAEDIPCDVTDRTNLKNYIRIGDSLGIHQIDFNSWFASLKDKTPHPLFYKQGIHWGLYGALFACDSLIKYIEHKKGIHMPHPKWSAIEYTKNARRTDDDMEKVLNLIFPVDTNGYWYPKWHYDDSATFTKPKVIYIGDSFCWPLMFDDIMNSNTDAEFWYYFNEVHKNDFNQTAMQPPLISAYNWHQALQKTDCVILLYTAHNLVKQSNTFIDSAYNYYYPGK